MTTEQIDARLSPPQPTPDARRVAHDVDALIAEREAELAELRERRATIEHHFRVQQAEDAEARARAAAEERDRLDQELTEAAAEMFATIAETQAHFQAAVGAINAAIQANCKVRAIGHRIAPNAKQVTALSLSDFIFRVGSRAGAMLRRVKVPGASGSNRLGPLDLPADIVNPKGTVDPNYDWRQDEERRQAPAINQLLQHGRDAQ